MNLINSVYAIQWWCSEDGSNSTYPAQIQHSGDAEGKEGDDEGREGTPDQAGPEAQDGEGTEAQEGEGGEEEGAGGEGLAGRAEVTHKWIYLLMKTRLVKMGFIF